MKIEYIILILIAIYFFFKNKSNTSEDEGGTSFEMRKVQVTESQIIEELQRQGATFQGALLCLAQAYIETGDLKAYGYNLWNFGKPSRLPAGTVEYQMKTVADDVGQIMVFNSLADACFVYFQYIIRQGRPNAYRETISIMPNVENFVNSLCSRPNYATACVLGNYQTSIISKYVSLRDYTYIGRI